MIHNLTPIRFDILEDEVEFLKTKPPELHDMEVVYCGTTSCAWGDISIRHGFRFSSHANYIRDSLQFSSSRDSYFLFCSETLGGFDRGFETPLETAARIQKYCDYVKRKRAIFAEYNEGLVTGKRLYQCNGNTVTELATAS